MIATVNISFAIPPGGERGEQFKNGSTYIRSHIFNPGMTDDVGLYTCRVIISIASILFVSQSNSEVLQIQSMLPVYTVDSGLLFVSVPPPQLTLTITPSNTTTLYEGTPVNLTCTATIDTTTVNTNITVSSMWIAPNGEQLTSSSSNDRITIVDMLQSAPYTSVLMFDPADDMDTGDYQCNVTVVDNSSQPLILPSSTTATTNLNITGLSFTIKSSVLLLFSLALPDPMLSVTSVGSTVTGQTVSLVCNVTMATDQIPHPNVTWVKVSGGSPTFPAATRQTTPTSTILTLSFSPLIFSHRGLYRCVVTHNISNVYTFTGEKGYNISVDCE